MDQATRTALVQHLGELTMDAICSVTRAKELEAENAELRRMVTEERMAVQRLQAELESARRDITALVAKAQAAPATPSTRRKARSKSA